MAWTASMYIKMAIRLCLNGTHCATVFPEELCRLDVTNIWAFHGQSLSSIFGNVDLVIDICRGRFCEYISQLVVSAHICQDGSLIFDLFTDCLSIDAQLSRSPTWIVQHGYCSLVVAPQGRMSSASAS